MSGKQDFKRLKQRGRLFSALQHIGNLFLVAVRHCGDDGLFIFKIAVDQSDADPRLGADVVHAGLVKTALGEANKGCIQNLGTPIWNRICVGLRHRSEKMNERSFIVKSDLRGLFSLGGNRGSWVLEALAANRAKDAALRREIQHSAQRDAPVSFDRASPRRSGFRSPHWLRSV